MKTFVAFALFLALCIACTLAAELRLDAVPSETEAQVLFQKFKVDWDAKYTSAAQEAAKFAVFQENLKEIVRLNKMNTKATFVINKFADWTKEERKSLSGTKMPENIKLRNQQSSSNRTVSRTQVDAIDWRDMNAVTPIKDQGGCGSCWAFSATECVESAYAIRTGNLNVLSPQDTLDCSGAGSCNGGYPNAAIDYAINGLNYDSDYPYVGQDQDCMHDGNDNGGYSNGQVPVDNNEDALYNALQYGPVGVAIDAGNIGFFGSGYMTYDTCDESGIDHGVQVVGLGYADDGTPVWIVRNSWNTWWADQGYFYIEYGTGACLIGQWSYYSSY